MYKISTESLFLNHESGSASNSFLRNPSRKRHQQTTWTTGWEMCAVFLFLVKRSFSTGGFKQTEGSTLNTWAGNDVVTRVTCLFFYIYKRHDCMHYICSDHLFRGALNQHLRRKQLHCIDNKTISRLSSTKGSAGISGIDYSMTASFTIKHQ